MNSLNHYEFYAFAPETWEAMLQAIREARESIDIEQYIFCIDNIGTEFLELLKEKKKEGVSVRLLLDTVGSWGFYNSSKVSELKEQGIEIRFFNPVSPWRIHNFTSWLFRDHRKALIFDKKIAFVGGLGVGDHMKDWRDTTAKVSGPAVLEISDSFLEYWNISKNTALRERIRSIRANLRKRFFITSAPYFKKRFLYYSLIEALRNAQKNILITTPYFIPDRRLSRVLKLAAKRRVDVVLMIPKTMDVPIVQAASEREYGQMLKRGIKIYEYGPEFHHGKIVIVDGNWATMGSLNLDNISFFYNFEANIVSAEKDFVAPLLAQFNKDLEKCKEITYSEWQRRPFIKKIKEFFAGFISDFL